MRVPSALKTLPRFPPFPPVKKQDFLSLPSCDFVTFPMSTYVFPARTTTAEIELGTMLQPKFGPDGLITCITTDHITNEVLMVAYMNAEALAHTIS